MLKYLLSFLFSISLISVSSAQVGPTVDAMGGSGIAGRNPVDAAALNSAALATFQQYYFGAGYYRSELRSSELDQYGVTLADSMPGGIMPGSFNYKYKKYDGVDVKEHAFRLGLALPLSERFAGGVALYKTKTDLGVGQDYSQQNADVSFLWAVSDAFSFGVLSKAVFGSKDEAVFLESKIMPTTGVGGEFSTQYIKLRGDAYYYYEANPEDRMSYHFGAETMSRGSFRLRAGFSLDDYRRENRYTVGLGWEGPRLRAAYSYQHEFRQDIGDAHSIDIWLDL